MCRCACASLSNIDNAFVFTDPGNRFTTLENYRKLIAFWKAWSKNKPCNQAKLLTDNCSQITNSVSSAHQAWTEITSGKRDWCFGDRKIWLHVSCAHLCKLQNKKRFAENRVLFHLPQASFFPDIFRGVNHTTKQQQDEYLCKICIILMQNKNNPIYSTVL